jgi:hypothetical protein
MEKSAIYWGVDPTSKEKAVNVPYRKWEQAHARDLSENDYKAILSAAREWMKVPVLARILDEKDSLGAVRDIQIRAALDLAIRDMDEGKYSVGLYPTVYNRLLAELGGKPENDTLLTMRSAKSSYMAPKTGQGVSPMNVAAEIQKFAAEVAATNPGLAFDLTNLAFRVAEEQAPQDQQQGAQQQQQAAQGQQDQAQQEGQDQQKDAAKYAALRGAVIKVAHENPSVRATLLPVLKMLKA